ncbi:MAG: hypothetical protein ACRD6W_08685 [Nitrososphaerales archaeon]
MAGLVVADSRGGFSERVADSVCRVLDVRCGKSAREAIFWNVWMTKSIGLDEVANGPQEFIENLRGIYGDLAAVLEEAMVEELRNEFGLGREVRSERESLLGVLERAQSACPRASPSA